MPKRPRGEKRPGDVIGAAIKVAKIATGEIEDDRDQPQSAGAELGRKGGKSQADKMTPEQRSGAARTAATKRWANRWAGTKSGTVRQHWQATNGDIDIAPTPGPRGPDEKRA